MFFLLMDQIAERVDVRGLVEVDLPLMLPPSQVPGRILVVSVAAQPAFQVSWFREISV